MFQLEHVYIHPETVRENVTRFPSADDLQHALMNLAGFYRSKPLGQIQRVRARIADEVVGYAKFHGCRKFKFVNITNRAFSCFACTFPASFELQFYEKMNPGEGRNIIWPTSTRWGCCTACHGEMIRADRENSFGDAGLGPRPMSDNVGAGVHLESTRHVENPRSPNDVFPAVYLPPTLDLRRLPMAHDVIEMLRAMGLDQEGQIEAPTGPETLEYRPVQRITRSVSSANPTRECK